MSKINFESRLECILELQAKTDGMVRLKGDNKITISTTHSPFQNLVAKVGRAITTETQPSFKS